jgi:hypothetical protein
MTTSATGKEKGLKIIGAGFGRTGTLSIKVALEELGFGPCYHMIEVFQHLDHLPQWEAAARGEAIDWRKLLEGYQATVDWPGCSFYKQLMEVYPDAKVLLTVRDPEKWYESAISTIYQPHRIAKSTSAFSLTSIITRLFFPFARHAAQLTYDLIWGGTFHNRFEDKEYAIAIFKQHIEEVKRYVPPEKLLVFNVKEGWKPLCDFLGVEIPPDKPFPYLNDRANFAGNAFIRRRARMRAAASIALAATLVAAFVFIFMRGLRDR